MVVGSAASRPLTRYSMLNPRKLTRLVAPDSASRLLNRLLIFSLWKKKLFQLEMEDGDEIDAMLHQTGGCLPSA
uniref:Uncharacterized protein n=1 Tax=Arundo donax TaxID=35708 RepID=A0A0A9DCU1_ARUDO